MLAYNKSNSKYASQLISVPKVSEPRLSTVVDSSRKGVLVGYSKLLRMPIFVDFDKTINPHALIVGMTGSGKTYFMKNLMIKLGILLNHKVILVDFTGEYKDFASHFCATNKEPATQRINLNAKDPLTYIDLGKFDEKQKIIEADSILRTIVVGMRHRSLNAPNSIFLMFDEAWKLLKYSDSLEIIIREGRKYRVCLLLSSQLIEDSDLVITSNIANLFVFRTQGHESTEKLLKNYNLLEEESKIIQNLDVGSFFLIQLYKSEARKAFEIEKFLGTEFGVMIRIILGDNMYLEINTERLEKILENLCAETVSKEIIKKANENGSVELWWIINRLISSGVDRHLLLQSLRKLSIKDSEIADAFALAIFSGENEKAC